MSIDIKVREKETEESFRRFRESRTGHAAFHRFPAHEKPMIEYPPITHPRGKDGGGGK